MMWTLLLNSTFEPLMVISWKKAVTLRMLGKVEVVEEYEDEEISSVSFSIKMPSVVRLLRLIRPRSRRVTGPGRLRAARVGAGLRFGCRR